MLNYECKQGHFLAIRWVFPKSKRVFSYMKIFVWDLPLYTYIFHLSTPVRGGCLCHSISPSVRKLCSSSLSAMKPDAMWTNFVFAQGPNLIHHDGQNLCEAVSTVYNIAAVS